MNEDVDRCRDVAQVEMRGGTDVDFSPCCSLVYHPFSLATTNKFTFGLCLLSCLHAKGTHWMAGRMISWCGCAWLINIVCLGRCDMRRELVLILLFKVLMHGGMVKVGGFVS